MAKEIKKVVLAYSGGLDTSIIIPWLKETYPGCEVICVAGNVTRIRKSWDLRSARKNRSIQALHRGHSGRICQRFHLPDLKSRSKI